MRGRWQGKRSLVYIGNSCVIYAKRSRLVLSVEETPQPRGAKTLFVNKVQPSTQHDNMPGDA
jgi:hypothetical protein